jgi:hypothetical protein
MGIMGLCKELMEGVPQRERENIHSTQCQIAEPEFSGLKCVGSGSSLAIYAGLGCEAERGWGRGEGT